MMMLIQVATEAAKSTPGIVIYIGSAATGSLFTLGSIWIREYFAAKKGKKNGNGAQPGKGEICQKHGGELIELKTKQDGTDKAIDEMKGHITTIEGDVKTLLQRIPARE
jgi:hypothetical protein